MTTFYQTASVVGSGNIITVPDLDDLVIAPGVFIGSTDGRLYVRGEKHLFCIGKPAGK